MFKQLLIKKLLNKPEVKEALKKLKAKNTEVKKENKTKTSTVLKNNNKRKGISKSILNQSNLLKKKSTIKKKTLLGG